MEEVLRRHAGEFDEAFHLLHSVDLVKNGVTYRVEIHQKMAVGYRKHFVARYFKKTTIKPDAGAFRQELEALPSDNFQQWVAIPGVDATADSARDTLNQALIWLGIHTKRDAGKSR